MVKSVKSNSIKKFQVATTATLCLHFIYFFKKDFSENLVIQAWESCSVIYFNLNETGTLMV